ncbi:hypothetical protein MGALLINA_03350 [Mycoplasmopsis gallinarum]|uniref:Transmembrane protein n=1 Tax=Mycoplasmopsis gallinarum TaxID=29557 RepID=A0A168RF69_9BACT|nr:hypothetical protein MGALLINA_03350 [Mycoplasmopsis gallinarum]
MKKITFFEFQKSNCYWNRISRIFLLFIFFIFLLFPLLLKFLVNLKVIWETLIIFSLFFIYFVLYWRILFVFRNKIKIFIIGWYLSKPGFFSYLFIKILKLTEETDNYILSIEIECSTENKEINKQKNFFILKIFNFLKFITFLFVISWFVSLFVFITINFIIKINQIWKIKNHFYNSWFIFNFICLFCICSLTFFIFLILNQKDKAKIEQILYILEYDKIFVSGYFLVLKFAKIFFSWDIYYRKILWKEHPNFYLVRRFTKFMW